MRRPVRRLSIFVLGALLALAFAASAAVAAPLRYVALGDSYSAASGVLPVDLSAPQCLRSTRNYPRVIAGATGAQLRDVTCGAAETNDFFESQYPGTAPQLDAVQADTQLVTMTIGGNDSGSSSARSSPAAAPASRPLARAAPAKTATAARSKTRSRRRPSRRWWKR